LPAHRPGVLMDIPALASARDGRHLAWLKRIRTMNLFAIDSPMEARYSMAAPKGANRKTIFEI